MVTHRKGHRKRPQQEHRNDLNPTTNLPAKATKTTKNAPATKPNTKPQVQPKSQEKAKPVATKGKETKMCLTGSGQPCKKELAGLGSDARYKSRLIQIATGHEPADIPTVDQLKKLGYSEDRIKLVPTKGMSMIKATEIIATRGWSNNRMAKVLKSKGYHYQYLFCLNAGHGLGPAKAQILPHALEWLWKDYPAKKSP